MSDAAGYRDAIRSALDDGAWHESYRWAKGWIVSGGGARSVEPWLVYIVGGAQQGQHRTAVHAADLALETWIEDSAARAVIHYGRGEVVRNGLNDPKTARADLEVAARDAPRWLRDAAEGALRECEEAAESSRKRKPAVDQAPEYDPKHTGDNSSKPTGVGRPPPLWEAIRGLLPQKPSV